MFKAFRNFQRDEKGNVAIEFGLTVPTLLVGFLIIFDVGRSVYTYSSLMSAAADAARMASIHGARSRDPMTDEAIITYAKSRALGINPNNVSVQISWSPNKFTGSQATVTVSSDLSFFITGLLPIEPISISGSSVMTVL